MEINLDKISERITEITNTLAEKVSEPNRTEWAYSERQIRRAIRQFDGEKHFIIVTGMLKAGKSTLVDLLARTSKASLVGFGVDTTLRPAVITMSQSEKGRIRVFYKPDGLDWEPAMQEVTDSLRGIADYNRQTVDFELTDDNLRNTLCRIPSESDNCLSAEPLLVIVEVPHNSSSKFFQNDCLLLDMPGLDSGFSEQSGDPEKYKAFFNECDLLLFVQSSVSPINDKAGEYLKYIGLTRDESTYRIVQNVMNAKYWLKRDVTDKEQIAQAKNGREVFKQKLGKGDVEITPVYVNLGMAYDSILGDETAIAADSQDIGSKKEQLLRESRFIEMEDGFVMDIINNGKYRHTIHCQDMLKKELQTAAAKNEKLVQKIAADILKLEAEKTEAEKKIAIIKNSYENYNFRQMQFSLSSGFVTDLKQKIITKFETLRKSDEYKDKLYQNSEDENTDKSIMCKASIINEFLEKCADIAKNFAETFFKDAYLDELVFKENNGEKNAIEYAQEAIAKIATDLKIQEIKLNDKKISAKVNKIGDLDNTFYFTTYDGGKYEIVRNWLGFQKKIEFNKEPKYNEIINHYKNELEKMISTNDNVARRITDLVRNAVKDDLKPQLEECESNLKFLSDRIETLQNDKLTLAEMGKKLRE
ncbi:MAG: dynamin family protein [Bacteroidales bacterium]|nr:dynamin family protein [Bacteroidales bacterium]